MTWLIKFRHALRQDSRTGPFRDGYLTVETKSTKTLSKDDAAAVVRQSLQERHDRETSEFEVRVHSVEPLTANDFDSR